MGSELVIGGEEGDGDGTGSRHRRGKIALLEQSVHGSPIGLEAGIAPVAEASLCLRTDGYNAGQGLRPVAGYIRQGAGSHQ